MNESVMRNLIDFDELLIFCSWKSKKNLYIYFFAEFNKWEATFMLLPIDNVRLPMRRHKVV